MRVNEGDPAPRPEQVHLYGWRHPAILAAAGLSITSGFAQFGVTATLADVAEAFGTPSGGLSIAAQVGLSGTTIGIGLGVIRLASLGALPLSGLADRFGRRRVLLGCSALGLAITAAASTSPGFWWFVAFFACSRPLLSATNALAALVAAEETGTADRAKAVALVTAGYGIGAGLIAIARSAIGGQVGFRGVFLLTLIPLALVPLLGRVLKEPERFERLRRASDAGRRRMETPVLGPLRSSSRGRLAVLCTLAFAIAFVTGPANTYLFLYTERVLGMSSTATAAMVLGAGVTGVAGLLAGRWLADRLGRRATAGGTQAVVALAAAVTYRGSVGAAVAGYLLAVLASSAYAPAFGSQAAELFPTSERGSVAGWLTAAGVLGAVSGLVAFGLFADAFDGFGAAALAIAVPVLASSALFARLPETRGLELEDTTAD